MVEANIDYELEYNNRKRVPEHVGITACWPELAQAYRQSANAKLDIPYGDSDRSRYDLFKPAGATDCEALIVYIHGGYWHSRDRKDFSHVARPFNEKNVFVAIPSYLLCPSVGIMDIVGELRTFLCVLWNRTKCRPVIVGHSAGGHLTAAMVATDWREYDGVPADLATKGYAISGVFDLTPLRHVSINDTLQLTNESAALASPVNWKVPDSGRSLTAVAGSLESDEFIRQGRMLADIWGRKGVRTKFALIEGTDHFTIVDRLSEANNTLVPEIIEMTARGPAS